MAKNTIDSQNQHHGDPLSHELPLMGNPYELIDDLEVVNAFQFKDMAELEAFMNEKVVVEVLPTPDRNAEFLIPLNVNGTTQNVIRNRQIPIRRKYVEVLARAKEVTVSTSEYEDVVGNRAVRVNRTPSLKFPFRTIGDSPRGDAWLKQILAEPA